MATSSTKRRLVMTAVVSFTTLFMTTTYKDYVLGKWHFEDSKSDVTLPEDIYISIKTTAKFHDTRVNLILKTWWNEIKHQAYFFTDIDDQRLQNMTGGHVVNTKCGDSHKRFDLCCKMGQEYDFFLNSGKRWWCHFDDDNYVNPSMLVNVLREYDWKIPYYLGRPSRGGDQIRYYNKKKVIMRFATGGAGICITRSTAELISPWMRNGAFVKTCRGLSQPDDVTLGFIATNRIGINLTIRNDFNSHLQNLRLIPVKQLLSQVVLSYSESKKRGLINVINLTDENSAFSVENDRSRILSYHCLKYPYTEWCPKKNEAT